MSHDTLYAIAMSFPSLESHLDGVHVFDVIPKLRGIAGNASNSSGKRAAARFCLYLWTRNATAEEFDLIQCYAAWDNDHREAFRAAIARTLG
jgi:hypothetical protein